MVTFHRESLVKIIVALVTIFLLLVGCNLPQSAPVVKQPSTQITLEAIETPFTFPKTEETAILAIIEEPGVATIEATSQVYLPHIEASGDTSQKEEAQATTEPEPANSVGVDTPTISTGKQLAYLDKGNLYLVEIPNGTPQQLTADNDLLDFSWSPDGHQLAVYDGKQLCFVRPDGSPSNPSCMDLHLDKDQPRIQRQIVWSPDQKTIVLWNSINPWDEEAVNWIILQLDQPDEIISISDPVDWGLDIAPDNEPGGIPGQPIFLPDGALLGTITHRWLCGSGGCHYQLFKFDLQNKDFIPFPNKPEEGFSEGQQLILSPDGKILVNFGNFLNNCEDYFSFVDFFHLDTQEREMFNLPQESLAGLTLSPDNKFAVIARTAGCSDPNQVNWASACGLSGLEFYPMQVWI